MDATFLDEGRQASGGRGETRSGLVVYSHLPSEEPWESDAYEVHAIECVGNRDYFNGLEKLWNKGQTLVIVEHDIGVSDELIQGLLDCPHPSCTYAYKLYWASTFSEDEHYAQRHGLNGPWVQEGAPICDFTGIGFCKVAPEAVKEPMLANPDDRPNGWDWSECDIAVTKAIHGPWHVHWPEVEHHHQ